MSMKIEDPHHAVFFLERNRLCIFPSPIEISQSPFAWKYYEWCLRDLVSGWVG